MFELPQNLSWDSTPYNAAAKVCNTSILMLVAVTAASMNHTVTCLDLLCDDQSQTILTPLTSTPPPPVVCELIVLTHYPLIGMFYNSANRSNTGFSPPPTITPQSARPPHVHISCLFFVFVAHARFVISRSPCWTLRMSSRSVAVLHVSSSLLKRGGRVAGCLR